MRRPLIGSLVAIALAVAAVTAPAQSPPPAEEGDVVLGGQTVLRILAPAGQVSAKDRAATVQQRLERARRDGPIAPADVVVRVVDANPSIFVKNRLILTVYGADAQAYKLSAAALADSWASKLREALTAGGPAAAPPVTPAPTSPAPASPAPPAVSNPAPSPPPAAPAPPAPSAPGVYFGRVSMYRTNGELFKDGFAAGVYDGASLFAVAAQIANGINGEQALGLFRCLDSKGDKLGQFVAWIDSAIAQGPDDGVAADVIVKACGGSFMAGRFFFRVSQYRSASAMVKQGFAAGIFDIVSWFAAGKTDGQGAIAFMQCLKSKGNLGRLRAWEDSALRREPGDDSAAGHLVTACQATRPKARSRPETSPARTKPM